MDNHEKQEYSYTTNDDKYHAHFTTGWTTENLEYVAEDAAKDYFHNYDGWEASWPVYLCIYKDGDFLGNFEVELEYKPIFMAFKKKV